MRKIVLLGLLLVLVLPARLTAQSSASAVITSENADQLVEVARLGNGVAHDVAWSPDGKRLAVASSIGIWLYDSLQAPPRFLEGHTGVVWDVAFSPDGSQLASASSDQTVWLWDVASGESLHVLDAHTSIVDKIEFSPDGSLLASGGKDGWLHVWDTQAGESIISTSIPDLEHHAGEIGAVFVIEFSHSGQYLAWGWWGGGDTGNGGVQIVETISWTVLDTSRDLYASHLEFTEDETYLHMGTGTCGESVGGYSDLWQLRDNTLIEPPVPDNWSVRDIFFTHNEPIAVVELDRELYLYSYFSKENLGLWNAREEEFTRNDCLYSPDGQLEARIDEHGETSLWNVSQQSRMLSLADLIPAPELALPDFEFHAPDPIGLLNPACTMRLLLVGEPGSYTDAIQLVDAITGEMLTEVITQHVPGEWVCALNSAAFSPDGSLIAIGGGDCQGLLGAPTYSVENPLYILDAATLEPIATYLNHTDRIRDVAFSADGTQIITGSLDGTIRIWGLPK